MMPFGNNVKKQCGQANCLSKQIEVLSKCKMIRLKSCNSINEIPSIRACITCGELVEHNSEACKNGKSTYYSKIYQTYTNKAYNQ